MRVLFDQNVLRNLRGHLPGHDVTTARALGWEELENGDLLRAAEDEAYEVFVTGDQNLSYQQNAKERRIAIVELTKNNWPLVKPRVAQILSAIDASRPGDYRIVMCDRAPDPSGVD